MQGFQCLIGFTLSIKNQIKQMKSKAPRKKGMKDIRDNRLYIDFMYIVHPPANKSRWVIIVQWVIFYSYTQRKKLTLLINSPIPSTTWTRLISKTKINYLIYNIVKTWEVASEINEFYEFKFKLVNKIL